jgi:methylase of polypeptide subunit release factors
LHAYGGNPVPSQSWTPAFRLRTHVLRRTQTRRSSRSERRPGRGGERSNMFMGSRDRRVPVHDFKGFQDLERQGWSDPKRASDYVALFASASDQAIGALLDAVDATPEMRALDLCCGQGNVSEALARCGCDVTGIDFSPAMLAFANAAYRVRCLSERTHSSCRSMMRNSTLSYRTWAYVTFPISRARCRKRDACSVGEGALP